jgi:hypothetical protein
MASWDLEPLPTLRPRRSVRAGRSPSARLVVLCAAAAAAVLAAAAVAQSAPARRLDTPRLSEIARASGPIPDSELSQQGISRLVPGAYWGGVYRAATGENVTIYASTAYPQDPALGQKWADFLSTLVHGSELSAVTVFLAPETQIGRVCGAEALACYSGQDSVLVAPGEDPAADISAEAVITHEYGHHVAAHRSNAPWSALDYGTKRWASYINVCSRTRQGQLFPGAEEFPQYQLNPGEGFAESYRVLNERKAGLAETPWQVVSDSLYPDNTALSLLQLDVSTPWQGATTTARTASLTRTTRARTFTVPTQLDGTLKVSLRPSAGTRLALDVYASSTRLAHAVGTGSFSRTLTICGQRSLRIRVSALRGNGSFRLTVAKP